MSAVFYEGNRRVRIGPAANRLQSDNDVTIAVNYCGICGSDIHIVNGVEDHRVTFPHVMGHEISGTIITTGKNARRFQPGDRVTVRPNISCGACPTCKNGHTHLCENLNLMGFDSPGAMQTQWTVPESSVHRLPDDVSMQVGALIEPVAVACHAVRRSRLQAEESAVILGGGPIGFLTALVASSKGAKVTIAEINPFRLAFAESFGLQTIDPGKVDITKKAQSMNSGCGADVVFEVTGTAICAHLMTSLARPRGRLVMVAVFNKPALVDLLALYSGELELFGSRTYEAEDFEAAIRFAQQHSDLLERVVTSTLPLSDACEGFQRIESGGEEMKILLDCRTVV